jgi:ABC-type uncharacterized transport system permease subunit
LFISSILQQAIIFYDYLRHNYGMNNSSPTLITFLVVALLYLVVAFDYWRNAKKPIVEQSLKLHNALIALGLVLHSIILYLAIFAHGFNLGFFNALSAILWLTVLIYWFANLNLALSSLQAFVLPPAAVAAVLPYFFSSNHYVPISTSIVFIVHIGIAMLAYSLFTFASLHALLMAIAERSMHHKTSLIKLPNFPPLLTMESLLFKIIGLGFTLLTITLISGMFFSEQIFGKAMQFNHKTIFSIASWFIYGWLLFGRVRYGWRGLKAIRWTLIGFLLLLLAYVGSKFILEVILHR